MERLEPAVKTAAAQELRGALAVAIRDAGRR